MGTLWQAQDLLYRAPSCNGVEEWGPGRVFAAGTLPFAPGRSERSAPWSVGGVLAAAAGGRCRPADGCPCTPLRQAAVAAGVKPLPFVTWYRGVSGTLLVPDDVLPVHDASAQFTRLFPFIFPFFPILLTYFFHPSVKRQAWGSGSKYSVMCCSG